MKIEISQPVTISNLIIALEQAKEILGGDCCVDVSGAYGSTGTIYQVYEQGDCLFIETDCMSG